VLWQILTTQQGAACVFWGNVSRPLNFTTAQQSVTSKLSIPDFFSVCDLKSKVFASPPHSMQELQVHIVKGLGTINVALLL
jgi:hypothetical protein